jgi:tetratricopeptide (TPR) repeat protein
MKNYQHKTLLNLFSLTLVIILLNNCKPADNSKKLLDQALKNKDYATAAFAYNNLLLTDTSNLEYKDSLARIYIKSGNYEGGVRLGEQVLVKQPKNLKLLELVGIGNGRLNNIDKAVANFNALFVASQDYTYLYKIAGMCFDSQKYNEADSLADIMIAKADTTKRIEVQLPSGESQSVPIVAACYNMKGAILAEMADRTGNIEHIKNAVPYFQKALKIYPEFSFPRLYLERIAQYMQSGGR